MAAVVVTGDPLPVTVNCAVPVAKPDGTTKLICDGDTYIKGATAEAPVESVTVSVTPPSDEGRLAEVACVVVAARFVPNIEAMEAGVTAPFGAAADCTATGTITP